MGRAITSSTSLFHSRTVEFLPSVSLSSARLAVTLLWEIIGLSFYELEQSPHEVSMDVAKEEVLGVHVLDGGIDGVERGKKVPELKYDENSVE